MIIVLKNANFSASNIGTLSTWRITRSIGAGATYEGPISVDKGAACSAVITLAEGYEIGDAGVVVTMGGVDLVEGEAYSINGNVITITIASVTGNVLIKVPTINTATGEEEEPETVKYTFTINPTPSDAAVTLTASGYAQSGNSITVTSGTLVTWKVSKGGYATQNGTQIVTSTDSKNVILNASSSGHTVTLLGGSRQVVSNMSEMTDFIAGQGLSAENVYFNVGRATDAVHALSVSAGQTITLSQPIDNVVLAYGLIAFKSDGTLVDINNKDISAGAWLSDSITLPANTTYIMIVFKRGDGKVDFSQSELALLPSALTIS